MTSQSQRRPRIVKRGVEDFDIDDGEPPDVDHLVFVVHGIGSVVDLKMRKIEEAVSEFRSIAYNLMKTHYRSASERGEVNRVEILPVSWHQDLHESVDDQLKKITLKSIPKLRDFMHDTILDALYYTSPVYSQKIVNQVGRELNKLFELFLLRNPTFNGKVSVAGHSLGSLILFDLLSNQKGQQSTSQKLDTDELTPLRPGNENISKRTITRTASYVIGRGGTGQPLINYPQLKFEPQALFAIGSPIGMFVTLRGIDFLGMDFRLPTCPGFFNIFHPFDPIAYRIEALINPELANQRAVLIPHHKGRKRMHLELRETMARVGADIKQKIVDSVRMTWNTVYQLATLGRGDGSLEDEVDQAIASEMGRARLESASEEEDKASGPTAGVLNQGRRVDYVLQEAPLESFNEYISAIVSHVCYWDSEDTVLFIIKDIYTSMGVEADSAASIAAFSISREDEVGPSAPNSSPITPILPQQPRLPIAPMGMDPTQPATSAAPLHAPPITGFVRK